MIDRLVGLIPDSPEVMLTEDSGEQERRHVPVPMPQARKGSKDPLSPISHCKTLTDENSLAEFIRIEKETKGEQPFQAKQAPKRKRSKIPRLSGTRAPKHVVRTGVCELVSDCTESLSSRERSHIESWDMPL